ncbi:elongation factor 1-gamma-A-like [Centruroides sculpturatus]|uniref:elongation factor 1-gamma-A-like n=1 Tax=Centruroides sculpturatus TaxID=218467 RepID=UPI000C6D0B03|nr:elongation factor 1-gamma-A-like [Centruroides sculpturatus]
METSILYSYKNNFRANKILIAAAYSGFKLDVLDEPPKFIFGETNKKKEFLDKFPVGKVPALYDKTGCTIFESNAIAHFVGNEQLRGSNVLTQTLILQWINFADNEILPPACTWLFPCLGIMQYNKQATERAKEDIKKVLKILNDHLLTRTYLVGENITQGDITVACTLLPLYQQVFEPAFRKPYTNVNRWFNTLINQPQFVKVLGHVVLCEKMAQFDAKKFQELQGSKGKEKSNKPPKDEKQKKEDKQKEDKKAKKEQLDEPDETEMILAQESKQKDPFEKFPKGTFVMDEFKRVYSNEDGNVSIPFFWNKFDKENYSIWYCEYKYPEDLTLVFMSCNLISGMFQRLEKLRKNAFASMILFGEDNNSTISGIWVWRGKELAFELSEDWQIDYESYSWKQLDPNSEETKKLVNEYLAWEGDFGGKKFNQGKIFK